MNTLGGEPLWTGEVDLVSPCKCYLLGGFNALELELRSGITLVAHATFAILNRKKGVLRMVEDSILKRKNRSIQITVISMHITTSQTNTLY